MKKFVSTYDRITRENRAKGKAEGKAEGKTEGKAEVILRLLARRFGQLSSETAHRVRCGSPDELDRWIDRVLDAATLADVFRAARSS